MAHVFYEHVVVESGEAPDFVGWGGVIAGCAQVWVSEGGSFVTVATSDKGIAVMSLPCAERVLGMLGRAIVAAKAAREARVEPTQSP